MADEPLYKTLPQSIVNLAYKYGILSSTSLSDGLYSSTFKTVAGSYNKDSFSIQGTGSFAPVAKSHTFSGDGFVNGSLTLNNASDFFAKFFGECDNGQITPSDFGEGLVLDKNKLTHLLADLKRFGRFTGNLLFGNSDVTVSGSYHHKTSNSEDSSLDEDVSRSFSNKLMRMSVSILLPVTWPTVVTKYFAAYSRIFMPSIAAEIQRSDDSTTFPSPKTSYSSRRTRIGKMRAQMRIMRAKNRSNANSHLYGL